MPETARRGIATKSTKKQQKQDESEEMPIFREKGAQDSAAGNE
jgi:hypothetical protein